jgi:acetyl-CoA carboxylase carboxyltransferase component
VATFVSADEAACLEDVRYLLSFLPANSDERPPRYEPADSPDRRCPELQDLVPSDPRRSYDVREVITAIVDEGEYLELHERWARNVVCALARVDGSTVGIVANQPAWLAGALDIDAAEKAARFVQTCDAFNIPLVTLVDVPGFLPGREQESDGIVRRGAKLLHAFAESTVPRITLVLRKAYGGAYITMNARDLGADFAFAWPDAEIGVMAASQAVGIIHGRKLAETDGDTDAVKSELATDYAEQHLRAHVAARDGFIDEVIEPRESRGRLAWALEMLADKRPRGGVKNIPL